jgi:glycosyltransferase involved in cell wall biosynthesis
MVRTSGLEGHVKLLGVREDIVDILSISDVFVLPSLWEGMPNVLLEAMASRVPIVATAIPANKEILTQELNALLIPAKDPAALASMIARLLTDQELRKKLTEQAYREVVNKHSLEILAKKHEKLYESYLVV